MSSVGVAELLGELTRLGVRLEPRGDSLAFFPRHKVPRELRERLQQHKPQLLELLRGETLSGDETPRSTLPAAPITAFAPYSVVIATPEPAALDSLLLSAIGQAPAPAEILLLAPANRRLRKRIELFGRSPIRFAESPLDAQNEFVVLLDLRTLLTRDWAARALAMLQNAAVGAAYSDHELLRTGGRTAYPATVTRDDLARSGFAAPTVMVRRSALVPLWERGLTTATVLRRMARAGWQLVKHDVPVLFRGAAERDYFDRQELAGEMVTLFIPLSGREHIWPELQQFLERQTWPHEQVRLVLCDTSCDARFQRMVRTWLAKSDYVDAHWLACPVPAAGLADAPRGQQLLAVNEILCRIYNRMRECLATDYVWILEDDIIPPVDVLERLLRAFDEHVATVSAPYRSRFDGRYLVWSRERAGNHGVHQLLPPLPDRPQVHDIRGSGFGCVVARAEVLRQHVFHLPSGDTHYDVRFFRELPGHWRRVVDWTCECKHLHNVPRPKCRITKRHLIYHITPFNTNDIWLRNVRQLLKRIDLFNGRREPRAVKKKTKPYPPLNTPRPSFQTPTKQRRKPT